MYSQIFLVTSVRGSGFAPMTAARTADGVIGFMNAALGLRGAATFFTTGFLAATFFAAGFLAATFFAAGLAAAFFATGFFTAGLAAAFFATTFFAAGFAAAFFAAGFLAAALAAGFLAVAIFEPPSQSVLGKCAMSRTANSGVVFIGMQVFFARFHMILRREIHFFFNDVR